VPHRDSLPTWAFSRCRPAGAPAARTVGTARRWRGRLLRADRADGGRAAGGGDVRTIAHKIAGLGGSDRSRVYRMSFWTERLMRWAMAFPDFQTELFSSSTPSRRCQTTPTWKRHIGDTSKAPASPVRCGSRVTRLPATGRRPDLSLGRAAQHLPHGQPVHHRRGSCRRRRSSRWPLEVERGDHRSPR